MPHLQALGAQGSDLTTLQGKKQETGAPAVAHLICDPQLIFDEQAVEAALDAACADLSGPELRTAAVAVLKDAQKRGRAAIAAAFGAAPFDAAGRLVMGDTGASTFSIAGVIYTSALEIFADGLTPPPAPVWSGTPAPPDGTVGAGYLYDYSPFLNTNRVNLTLETGTMPAGMSFVGSYLTGTPTEDGDFTGWTVRATNVTGTAVSASHSLTVNPASNWILADGTWNDSGEWVDTATWNDGV